MTGWIVLAHLTRTRGNKGELCAIPLTDYPERFQSLKRAYIDQAPYEIEQVWYHKGQPIFKFRGVDTISDAEKLADKDVSVPEAERFQLPAGEYYYSDLIDCEMVRSDTGDPIGTITGWQETGGPVLLEIDHGRILVPFASALLKRIDLERRRVEAELPEGLADLNS